MNLCQLFSIRQTPQHQPIPGTNQTLNEAGMLNEVGFDTATPQLIANFVAG